MNKLRLIIPQWHASGDSRIADGCRTIYSQVAVRDCTVIDEVEGGYDSYKNIKNYEPVLKGLQAIKSELQIQKPIEIFTIGGDCGIEFPLVSYLASLYSDNLGIVWIDAHGDANTPETSTSGNFHGMPVRCLCGEGEDKILSTGFSRIKTKALVYVGTRDLDQPEIQWLQNAAIPIINQTVELQDFLTTNKFRKIFVHLDLDVIDPVEFPSIACPTSAGLSVKDISSILEMLSQNFHIVGATLTECTASNGSDLRPISAILDWWKKSAAG